MINREDIEITELNDVYCDECEENLTVISGYYNDNLIYSMDIHEDTAETKDEIIDMVIDTCMDMLKDE